MIASLLNVRSASELVTGTVIRIRYSFLSSFIQGGHSSARCCNSYDCTRPCCNTTDNIKLSNRNLSIHEGWIQSFDQDLQLISRCICVHQFSSQFVHLAGIVAKPIALISKSAVSTTSVISRFTSYHHLQTVLFRFVHCPICAIFYKATDSETGFRCHCCVPVQ